MKIVFDVIGWSGATLFILSYYLLSRGIWKQNELKFNLANLLGAICLVINAIHFRDAANILVNSVWATIALIAIYNCWNSVFRIKS